jgi:hypothetical protein
MRCAGVKAHVLAAAFGIEAELDCDCFEQRAFTDAILADQECDRRMQFKAFKFLHGRNAKRKSLPITYAFAVQPDCSDKAWAQSGHA